ncbi:MAG: rod shape-determining protein MreC [Nitrospirales bacterium]|nr:rod shape-determining protein MreC [Nitrospirales bacterium]
MSTGLRRISIVIVVLCVGVWFLLPRQSQAVLGWVGNPLSSVLEVPLKWVASLQQAVGETWERYVALQHVEADNQALTLEVARLQGEVNLLKEQAIIAEEFERLLTYQQTAPMKTVPARIIGRNVSNWYRAVIIDKGQQDGIEQEMGVITEAGVVGRIIRVNPSTAVVLLVTDPNVAVTGMIQKSRDEGIIQGTPQGTIQMKYLPPLSTVDVDDRVVTSGLAGDFPRGLQIGKIQSLIKADTDLFQAAEIVPIVDFAKLEGVLVITTFQESIPINLPAPLPPPSS